jgi:hypothetical protein
LTKCSKKIMFTNSASPSPLKNRDVMEKSNGKIVLAA